MNSSPEVARTTPTELGNAFLAKYANDTEITHMKLQKLVYMTHGYWLQENDMPVLTDDPEVWTYGPVFSIMYTDLRGTKNARITEPVLGVFDDQTRQTGNAEILALVDRVWAKYGSISATKLSDLTHLQGSPWHQMAVRYNFRVPKGLKIPVEMVRDYYRTKIPTLD